MLRKRTSKTLPKERLFRKTIAKIYRYSQSQPSPYIIILVVVIALTILLNFYSIPGSPLQEKCYRTLHSRTDTPPEHDLDKPINIDDLYLWEKQCYWLYLQENCKSLTDCPRAPDELISGMRSIAQKNFILARLLLLWSYFADEYDIRWFMVYGSLLGTVRHNGIIPHDYDIDIGIFAEDLEKLKHYHKALPKDIVFHIGDVWPSFWIRDLQSCLYPEAKPKLWGFSLDFWVYEKKIELTQMAFGTMKVPIPVDFHSQLKHYYGNKKKYMKFEPHKIKKMKANFTTQSACPGISTIVESCGLLQDKDGKFYRGKHLMDVSCKDLESEGKWTDDIIETFGRFFQDKGGYPH